jgi:hypothetical protein
MSEQEAHEALEALNTKIGSLEQMLAEVRAGAAVYAEEVSAIDDEIAEAAAAGQTNGYPALILRRLKASEPLCIIGECLRRARDELEKWREERKPIGRELLEPYRSPQETEEENAESRAPGRRAA